MPVIEFRTLGTLDLRRTDGPELHSLLAQPKRVALLTYLCLANPRGFQRRDTLLGLFWPDADQAHARNSLRNALHVLRHTLGENSLHSRGDEEIAVNVGAVWCDSVAFEDCLKSERVEEALELYRGDLLTGFFLNEVPAFESWLESERTRLRGIAARAARMAAERCESDHNHTEALGWARRAVELTGTDERAVRRLIELSARLGDRAGALQAYDNLARHLATEFEADPSAETLALVELVRGNQPVVPRVDHPQTNAPTEVGSPQQPSMPGYSIKRELGRGGMATVLLARDLKHDRLVAIKILLPEMAALLGTERFLSEISIAAGLRHPNILPLLDSGQANGLPYYTMPYVEGETLRSRLRRERCLPLDDAIRITLEIADALGYAHGHGIIHRDIKPENILLENAHALVADFGIARALSHVSVEQRTQAGLALGTAAYMSPEQAEGVENIDVRTDIYALASVLYEMLAGDPPFVGSSAQSVLARKFAEPAPPLRSVRNTVPPTIERTILKALSRAPVDRFGTVKDFADALKTRADPVSHAKIWPALAAAAVISVISFALWQGRGRSTMHESRATLTDRRLVTTSGYVAHSAISPDGKTLAYVATRCRTMECAYRLELKEVDGSSSRVILDGVGELASPGLQWSPDGSKMLIHGWIDQQRGTFLMSALGGVPRRIGQRRTAFWKGGDSLLFTRAVSSGNYWILISAADGVPRDSIEIARPADAIGHIVPIPNSNWIAVALWRGRRVHWMSINRNGRISDSLPPRPPGPPRASADALWLSPAPGPALRSIVRIPFDARNGRFGIRQDTMYTGDWVGFDVTPDGSTFVFDEGRSEFSAWALEMRDAIRGNFPENRRLLTATSDLVFEVSPDGKRILVGRAAGLGLPEARQWDITPFAGGTMVPLGAKPATNLGAFWTDSVTIPVATQMAGRTELALLDVNTGSRSSSFVVPDSTVVDALSLSRGEWVWLVGERVIRLHRPGEAVRTIPFPEGWLTMQSLAPSPDGKKLLLVGRKVPSVDTYRVTVMSLPDGALTPVKTIVGSFAFAVWLADGSIMLAVWYNPDSMLTLYRLRESGEITWTARIPRPVWGISVSADMKRTSLTVRDYRGDASMSRVVRD